MFNIFSLFFLLAGTVVTASSPALADEQSYIDRFRGSWSGTGTVLKNAVPIKVICNVAGTPTFDRLVIDGTCALSVFRVRVGADIVFDPASKRYSGTYIGAEAGPALISGRRDGALVDLVVTWPKLVHGDRKARMVIQNTGAGTLRMTTFDNVVPGGPQVMTSDTVLAATRSVASSYQK